MTRLLKTCHDWELKGTYIRHWWSRDTIGFWCHDLGHIFVTLGFERGNQDTIHLNRDTIERVPGLFKQKSVLEPRVTIWRQ